MSDINRLYSQGRQSRGVGGVATPPEFWKGGLNPVLHTSLKPNPDF